MPQDKEPLHLRFIYPFTESWDNVFIKEGQIEIDLPVTLTPTPIPTLTPTPSSIPTVTPVPLTPTPMSTPAPTETATEIPTPEEKGIPGFEVIFAILGLAVAYLLRRRE
jgi:hypothetical protein